MSTICGVQSGISQIHHFFVIFNVDGAFFVRLGQYYVHFDALAEQNTIPGLKSLFDKELNNKNSKTFRTLEKNHPVKKERLIPNFSRPKVFILCFWASKWV